MLSIQMTPRADPGGGGAGAEGPHPPGITSAKGFYRNKH